MTVLKITEDDFEDAVNIAAAYMKAGSVIVYPSDTVYGIGGDATSEEVVHKIHRIKGMDRLKPLSVMCPDIGMVEYYCETGLWEDMILGRYLPGPYTFIMKKRIELPASQNEKLGVRIPESLFCQALCRRLGRPILTTSANPTGQEPPVRFDQVDKKILEKVDLAIDGGPTKYLAPSLIVDLVDRKFMREGGEEIDLIELPER
jgi:L-threonylcarbamoyladenylate synthase